MLCWPGRCRMGRRFVPPRKRPSTGVAARKRRERPRPHDVHAAQEPTGGVAHAPCQCRRCAGARVGILSENPHGRERQFPPGRNSKKCFASGAVLASAAPNFPRVIASGFCGRSGSQFSGSAWARQGSASPLRALDPPGALPRDGNYRSDSRSHDRYNALRGFHAFNSPRDCMRVGQMIRKHVPLAGSSKGSGNTRAMRLHQR
jgi:hypothetical protein